MSLFTAVTRALRDIWRPRILAVVLLPMLGAILLWTLLLFVFWTPWLEGLRSFIDGTSVGAWLTAHADWLVSGSTIVLLIALTLPAMFVTAVLVTELVAMPVVVSVVSSRYPQVERKGHASAAGSIVNATVAVLVFALLWIVTLPLWLTGLGAIVLPAINSAYLNQRLFRYEALAEHATRDEYRAIVSGARWPLYGLGLMLSGLYYIPFVNLIAPVVTGLAFTHYGLAALSQLREGHAVITT